MLFLNCFECFDKFNFYLCTPLYRSRSRAQAVFEV